VEPTAGAGLAVVPALVSLGGRDAATVAVGELAACAVLTAAECLLQVDRLKRKMMGKIASRVNITKGKGL
jgi:hypothetical protein